MDTLQLRITLPSRAMAAEVERSLAGQATVEREPAVSYSIEAVTMLVSLAAGLVSLQAARTQLESSRLEVLKKMLEVKAQLAQQGQDAKARIGAADGDMRSFADADEAFLRQLLGLPEA
ncbi:hypothetical protein K2Z83_26160 [Oscillochloris sp. ZM17-4]|uniref:hypothetical protein n=1 Tax=Oscillochloris sp. ZM17-4 TaxID=2866714 RepID=UPI001C73BEB4|nr:hypothetical protein [Oscillochloris sp. ZM17-4]MBX0331138.1 hypothetical protein [Oscillochloris sp. ZM17-4]